MHDRSYFMEIICFLKNIMIHPKYCPKGTLPKTPNGRFEKKPGTKIVFQLRFFQELWRHVF